MREFGSRPIKWFPKIDEASIWFIAFKCCQIDRGIGTLFDCQRTLMAGHISIHIAWTTLKNNCDSTSI